MCLNYLLLPIPSLCTRQLLPFPGDGHGATMKPVHCGSGLPFRDHYLSDTRSISHAPFHFTRSIHTSHHYLHAFVAHPRAQKTRFSLESGSRFHISSYLKISTLLDIQQHRFSVELAPILGQQCSINDANITTCKPPVSCQLSAVVHFAQGSTRLERLQPS